LSTSFDRAALAVSVLSLGEVSAGKLVATPGMASYATDIFTQMHYGVTNELAARCVLMLLLIAAGGVGVALIGHRSRDRKGAVKKTAPSRSQLR
jgi:ABC-type spermidine/putrescine transport system permease subunit II